VGRRSDADVELCSGSVIDLSDIACLDGEVEVARRGHAVSILHHSVTNCRSRQPKKFIIVRSALVDSLQFLLGSRKEPVGRAVVDLTQLVPYVIRDEELESRVCEMELDEFLGLDLTNYAAVHHIRRNHENAAGQSVGESLRKPVVGVAWWEIVLVPPHRNAAGSEEPCQSCKDLRTVEMAVREKNGSCHVCRS
jgi:hypothetical protein